MMHFKLDFLVAAVLATTPWGGGSSIKHTQLEPPKSPPWAAEIRLYKPLPQLKTHKLAKLGYQPFPVAPAGSYDNNYAAGNCTWLVASMKRVPSSWGNANTWALNARAQGYTVSNTPITGAIAQTSRGDLGHVAVVLDVRGDQVYIIEMNVQGYGVIDHRWEAISDFVYIYL